MYGILIALTVVGVVLDVSRVARLLVGTVLRHPMLAAVVLVFLWFPVNLVLHAFSFEELSPISLTQALPTVLQTPWRSKDASAELDHQKEDLDATDATGGQLPQRACPPDRRPWIVPPRISLKRGQTTMISPYSEFCAGTDLPALLAVALALLIFHRRDL